MKKNKGVALIITVIALMTVSIIILGGFSFSFSNAVEARKGQLYSEKSYYYAEGALEDIIIRSRDGKKMPASNPSALSYGDGTATISLGVEIGGSQQIISTGNVESNIRKVTATRVITTTDSSFFFGVQVGAGGLTMFNNAKIIGNVYSNGTILGAPGAQITGDAWVAGNGNKIDGVNGNIAIGNDAHAFTLKDCTVVRDIYYNSGGSRVNCDAGGFATQNVGIVPEEPMPITDASINGWKNDATVGGIISGNYNIDGTVTLGPKKITGNLTFTNGAKLIVSGTIYVVGNIIFGNNNIVELSSGYGTNSGIFLADGLIDVSNNAVFKGSGQAGSYILVLSTNSSVDIANPAIYVKNNADAAIFYTSQGLVKLSNNINLKEVTGYKVFVDNNTIITYESGLASVKFTSGPAGGFTVVGWQEIE